MYAIKREKMVEKRTIFTSTIHCIAMKGLTNEMPINEACQYLLTLGKRNAQVYTTLPSTKAILITGSASEGLCDFYSDLDMIVYHDTLPSEEMLLAACQQNQGEGRKLYGERSEGECVESYLVHGIECQFGHTTIAVWERDMALVLEQLDVTSPIQKALSGMHDAIPLYGEPLIRHWQMKLANYPDTLAEAMVRHNLTFSPLWVLQERIATRDATIWCYQMLVETAHHLIGVLAGLNRLYYSSFQFKRMHHFVAQMAIAPANFADRLETLFHPDVTDPASTATQLKELVQETVALVEQHMSQIDTAQVHITLEWQGQAWKPM